MMCPVRDCERSYTKLSNLQEHLRYNHFFSELAFCYFYDVKHCDKKKIAELIVKEVTRKRRAQ